MVNGVLDSLAKASAAASIGKQMLDIYFSEGYREAIQEALSRHEYLANRINEGVTYARQKFAEIETTLRGEKGE